MLMADILDRVSKISSSFLLRKVVTHTQEHGSNGWREVRCESTHNVVDGLFAISKSLDGLAKEIRDMNPRNQRSE